MDDVLNAIKSFFASITDLVLKALIFWWDKLIELEGHVIDFLMERIGEILPDTGYNLSNNIIDYFECLNYYFPVKELFAILTIYLQFRIALFVVRATVKVMSAGQV